MPDLLISPAPEKNIPDPSTSSRPRVYLNERGCHAAILTISLCALSPSRLQPRSTDLLCLDWPSWAATGTQRDYNADRSAVQIFTASWHPIAVHVADLPVAVLHLGGAGIGPLAGDQVHEPLAVPLHDPQKPRFTTARPSPRCRSASGRPGSPAAPRRRRRRSETPGAAPRTSRRCSPPLPPPG
jgi:hypothetical protein